MSTLKHLTLGLDIGTTKICAIVIDNQNGTVIDSVSEWNNTTIKGLPFEHLQDPEKILSICEKMCKHLVEKHEATHFASIGISGQMHGILYVDDKGFSVSPLATWQDRRSEKIENGLNTVTKIAQITGEFIPVGYGLATHMDNVWHDLVPHQATQICTIHDYVAMRLAGQNRPIMHISNSQSFGFYHSKTKDWDYKNLKKLGMDQKLLPKNQSNPSILGKYQDIPVCIAIGDNQASYLGSVNNPNTLLINIGTGSQISIQKTENMITNLEERPLSGNQTIIVGSSIAGGSAYALLKDFFADIYQMSGQKVPDDLYDHMNNIGFFSKNPPTIQTCFRGTRNDSSMRGSITGLGYDNFTAANFVYGVLDGIADELYQLFLESNAKPLHIIGSGNAIRKNPLLREIIVKKFGLPLYMPKHEEEAAFGAALFSTVAVGIYSTLEEAAESLIHTL